MDSADFERKKEALARLISDVGNDVIGWDDLKVNLTAMGDVHVARIALASGNADAIEASGETLYSWKQYLTKERAKYESDSSGDILVDDVDQASNSSPEEYQPNA